MFRVSQLRAAFRAPTGRLLAPRVRSARPESSAAGAVSDSADDAAADTQASKEEISESPAPLTSVQTEARVPLWLKAQQEQQAGTVGAAKRRWKELPSVDQVVQFLRDENAQNICVLDISQRSPIATYFVFAGGYVNRHLLAMAEQLVKETKHCPLPRDLIDEVGIEGKGTDWMIVDLGDIVVHFMADETRAHFNIESLWTGMDLDDWFKTGNQRRNSAERPAPPAFYQAPKPRNSSPSNSGRPRR